MLYLNVIYILSIRLCKYVGLQPLFKTLDDLCYSEFVLEYFSFKLRCYGVAPFFYLGMI